MCAGYGPDCSVDCLGQDNSMVSAPPFTYVNQLYAVNRPKTMTPQRNPHAACSRPA